MKRSSRPRLALLPPAVLVLALLPTSGARATGTAASSDPEPAAPPITLKTTAHQTASVYGKGVQQVPIDVRLVAGDQPFEVWSTRASYDDPVTTVWRSPDGDVELPQAMDSFRALKSFLSVTVTDTSTGETKQNVKPACLSNYAERVRPDAPARSPYPQLSCFSNPYSLGQVMGVQAGWAVPVLGYDAPLRLAPGLYDVRVKLTRRYAAAFGTTSADSAVTTRLSVVRDGGGGCCVVHPPEGKRGTTSSRPAKSAPHGAPGAPEGGPVPDLQALPAWAISLSPRGGLLRFSATVWNAGDSPLVVDGFRREGEDEMDAYQYFFDADGNQTGYVPVGGMEWDPRPTHMHWHFEDFASYTLLDANKDLVGTSHKEAFCLANTDSVDLTRPDADWNPYNTDLATACGDYGSLSVREVLAAGWGDTYGQYRAGQSFRVGDLPNGVYYVAVDANPHQRLTEASFDNNQSLRKIVLGGKPGQRTLRVPQIGLVDESGYTRGH